MMGAMGDFDPKQSMKINLKRQENANKLSFKS